MIYIKIKYSFLKKNKHDIISKACYYLRCSSDSRILLTSIVQSSFLRGSFFLLVDKMKLGFFSNNFVFPMYKYKDILEDNIKIVSLCVGKDGC